MKLIYDKDVYEPAEDSYLLLKNIVDVKGKRVLDVGTGTGILAIASALKGGIVEGIDINPKAIELAKKNAKLNGVKVKFYLSNLFENVKGKYDVILFNPPYLPTEEDDKIEGYLNYAFDGGKEGREILDRFIDQVPNYLKEGGVVQLVQSSLTDIEKTLKAFKLKGFSVEVVDKLKVPFEYLVVINAYKRGD
ncbi:methylase [Methanocaldococcus infernus ME]|uniref:Methylase n=1 Tax=Methanocaldococcus infernus (strain DSM 11812 / JCM 15783 / ME) TaxID=573063 RepID=D5VS60_METIM|nr:HemK2/MTQ2 family protein methyltransferase [Methanocaldococcus infernus]ADG13413.1 methylase [Methanocaldococcus infernus ME]